MRALLLVFVALALGRRFPILSTGDEAARAWKRMGRSQDVIVPFRLNFAYRNLDTLDKIFADVTDFRGDKYGQYLTNAEVRALLAPSAEDKNKVLAWVGDRFACVDKGLHLECQGKVREVEKLLDTKLYRVRNSADRKHRFGLFDVKAMDGLSVPDELLEVLNPTYPVGGSLAVLQPPRKLAVMSGPPGADSSVQCAVVPQTLEAIYKINGDSITPPFGKITQAVAEFGGDNSYAPSDLKRFSEQMLVNIEGKVAHHGPFNPSPPDAESTLDIQYIASTGRNGTSSFWVVGGWLTEWLQDLVASDHAPEVNSISWGADERAEGASQNEAIDKQFQALTVTGVTFLAASGDAGASGSRSGCRTRYVFNPGYPATSPYVLSVGATMFDSFQPGSGAKFDTPFCQGSQVPCAGSGTEVPASLSSPQFSSGGGFSTYAQQPAWQAQAVQAYLNDASIPKPPSKDFTGTNRGFPDVCAQGWNIFIEIQGQAEEIGGTSASSPIFAGMLSLMNDHQRKKGKPTLGFVNPLIYAMANQTGIFHHVGNLNTNNKNGCKHGYVSGDNVKWDPVCGLGTIDFTAAIAYLDANL